MMRSLDVLVFQDMDCALPPRSHLYCLEPIGVGTLDVEQLTSYVQRLAFAHGVTTKTFVERALVPLLSKRPKFNSSYRPSFLYQAFPLNGHSIAVENWVAVLETLTLRHDLHSLTMLTWAHVISIRRLLRRARAWCSVCLEEMRVQGATVYEPLLWALEVVTVCVEHRQYLTDVCPNCKKTVPTLSNNALPGYCSRCQQWLGRQVSVDEEDVQMMSSEEFYWQQFVQQALGNMLAQASKFDAPAQPSNIVRALTRCINQVTNGNVTAFSRDVGIAYDVVRDWLDGIHVLPLHLLLRVCYCLDRNPLEFLTLEGVTVLEQSQIQLQRMHQIHIAPKRQWDMLPRQEQQCLLHKILEQEEFPPPSLPEVVRRLECTKNKLVRWFPEECQQIREQYQVYRKLNKARRLDQLCAKVRDAIRILAAQGETVGIRAIETYIGASGILRSPVVRAVYIEELQLLGYGTLLK